MSDDLMSGRTPKMAPFLGTTSLSGYPTFTPFLHTIGNMHFTTSPLLPTGFFSLHFLGHLHIGRDF